jgi:nitroreductase
METLQAIHSRKSVRAFLNKPVPTEIIRKVLEAGVRAPSGGNMQPWRFMVVTDQDKMAQFDPEFHQAWVENAPAMIVGCVDPHDTWKSYDEDDHFYLFDVAAAIENMLLAIHDMGLGAVWVLSCSKKKIRRLLEIPKHWQIISIIPFGYYKTDKAPETKVSPRRPLSEVAFLNSINNPIREVDQLKPPNRTGFDGP